MKLPFTAEQFFDVFREYNEAVWPAQIVLLLLAVLGLLLVITSRNRGQTVISGILALLWAWLALAYHLTFFTRINLLAYAFAALSLIGAGVFVWEGIVRGRLRFAWHGGIRSWVGALLITFALLIYPFWSWATEHAYPYMPTFGLPCPTTLYTMGLLAFLARPYPRTPHLVPIIWSFIGAQAAFFLGVPQDISLLVAGLFGLFLIFTNR